MSRENVEIVPRSFAAYVRGDVRDSLAYCDSDVVTRRVAPAPDPQTYHGHEGLLQVVSDWTQDFDRFHATAEELIDAGPDQVIARVHQEAYGKHSGVPVEADFWFVYTLRKQKIVGLDMYMGKRQAFEAAGLPERP
jgi:ketosteroid isomerase-like protein